MYTTISVPDVEMNLTNPVYTTSLTTYLYLVLDVPLDRGYIGRYMLILGKLFTAMRTAN